MIHDLGIININPEMELDTAIYRVYNSQRLLEMFANKQNVLVRPALWDDPLENFILNTAASKFNENRDLDLDARNHFYGQCWSLVAESDAMWRIYSHDKSGIKVKTTIRKLFSSLDNSFESFQGTAFIGKVKYLHQDLLNEKIMNERFLLKESVDSKSKATSLMFKRLEFDHEKEVRLLYLNNHRELSVDLFRYPIDPHNLFEEIVFDPRIPNETFEVYKYYLIEKLGFPKEALRQSGLYKIPIFPM